MNNPIKIMVGMAVGAGVGMAISRVLERGSADAPVGIAGQPKETFRERWERARIAGDAARAEKEAELRSHFRRKVHDPTAFHG